MTDLSARLDQLSPAKRALLEKLARRGPVPPADASAPRRRTGEGPVPLSFSQRRLWFLDRLEPGTAAYTIPAVFRVRGPLDPAALERALRGVVERHEALRTTFHEVDGEPVQVVAPSAGVPLAAQDLRSLSADERDEEALRRVRDFLRLPFDLSTGPLLRGLLVRTAEEEWTFALALHHVASDGWSQGILFHEMGALYAGESTPLAMPEVQYPDFALWQKGRAAEWEGQLAWWKERLAGAPTVLELPAARPRPPVRSGRGAKHAVSFPRELADALAALGREEGASPFMVLLAAFQALLSRLTGEEDVPVGTPVANRTRRELERTVGFFVNTLVVRGDLSGDPPFRELLGRVRESTLGAYEHQDLPFERLVEALHPERVLGHAPVFQVLFALQNASDGELALSGCAVEALDVDLGVAPLDLELSLRETEGGLRGTVRYSTDRLDADDVARLLERYERVLRAVAEDPDVPVSRIPLLGDAERATLLEAWNDTAEAYPPEPLHRLFEAQARATPSSAAVLAGEEALTFAELDARSNRLAHHLVRSGVGPEVRVGICLERGAEMVVALLAVLKAGGAYVPLDPAYPAERLAFMLRDSAARALVTTSALVARLPEAGAATVLLDGAAEEISGGSSLSPEVAVDGENAAYVIYTSGSTGRPKGVVISHRAAAAFLHWARGVFPPEERAGVLASTSLCFDLSVFEVFLPLCAGGTVIVAENALHLPSLPAWGRVTLLNTVPSAAAELVRAGGIPAGVRTVNLAGEPLKGALAEALYAAGVERVYNLYGPTEDTTYSTFTLVPRGVEREPGIGRPISNSRAYVLDRALQPVPAGVTGELYLGGEGLARGYLDRPDLTAERFVPDPFGAAGSRMYRTGDRARWLAGGTLDFLGRADHQVKVRGFRIEPGEIEAALLRHPCVREALVMAREDAPGDVRLVAYLVGAGGAPDVPALREAVKEKLPDYMVPSAFVVLDALPLTANGKVDRRALPAPERASGGEAYVAPRTPTEELLSGSWAELLGMERVGATESFFDLGGHSLLATRLVSRLRSVFGVEVPVRAVFEAPTVAALAARVDDLLRSGEEVRLPPLERVPRDGDLPLSFGQERLWVVHRLDPQGTAYHMPYLLRLRGPLDVEALGRAVDVLVERHESLRTRFPEVDGRPVQRVSPPCPGVLRVHDGVTVDDDPAGFAEALARAPFDLESGPLFRAGLVRVREEEHLLVLSMHHAVSDGWSMEVVFRELGVLYAAFAEGAVPGLTELPVRYADFSAWQRACLRGEVLDARLAYWRGRLAGAPPVLELPTDRPRSAVQSTRGASAPVAVSTEAARALRALSRQEGATLFMTLLAGWQLLLAKYSGQDDVVVGTPVAGRTHQALEGLVGFFVNTLALRTELGGDPGFRVLLGRVRETTLGAYAHQDLPFERIVEELHPGRAAGHAPLVQATFLLQSAPLAPPLLPGVEAGVETVESGTTKFDLSLGLREVDGGLGGEIRYNADLFEAATIARMAVHLRTLLEGIAADPDGRLSGLPLLDEGERRRIVEEGSEPPRAELSGLVPALVEEVARTRPQATAVRYGAERLTHAELGRRANRLAHHLVRRGVGPEVRVGICLGTGPERLVSVLAVLRAGGAYLPLDPGYPAERLAYMLRDAGVSLVVTDGASAGALPEHGAAIVRLDLDAEAIASESGEDPRVPLRPENLAYVLYTSGSTGLPKGVMVEHGALAAHARAVVEHYGLGPDDRVLQFSSFNFDVSVEQMLPPLTVGACVVLRREEVPSVEEIGRYVGEEGVTLLNLPTAQWHLLADEWSRGEGVPRLDGLRLVLVGGEAMLPEAVERWRSSPAAGVRLLNGYGPTETVVTATTFDVGGDYDARAGGGSVPIGRKFGPRSAHVLDPAMEPVPDGVTGELYLGGAAVARGYLGRPELTAEKFVPDPFSPAPGARLYRTGDRVRRGADGALHFLGRADQQVKIRGFRVEPGEVETALLAHPDVREAAVVAREDAPGDRRLVGYVVPREGRVPDAAGLKAFLGARLPGHMVPSALVMLEALPLSPTGKVDRRALPAPERAGDRYVAPRTAAEQAVAAIYAEVLGTARVGGTDDFFELGGHSLLATRVLSRIRSRLGVDLPFRTLFETPTVERLAAAVEAGRAESGPRMEAVDRSVPPPLSFSQQRLWFLDRMEPVNAHYNVPFALRLRGTVDAGVLERAFAEVVRRHESLRTTFGEVDGEPVQVIATFRGFTLPVEDLSGLPAAEREAAMLDRALADSRAPFDLEKGPLFRAGLLRLGDAEHVLLVNAHHVVTDAWSFGVLYREVSELYGAFSRGEPSPLPEPHLQYADFGAWQREHLTGEVLERQLGYWAEQLEGAPPLLELAADRPRPAVQSHRAGRHPFLFPPELLERLHAAGRAEGATLFMVLLAGMSIMLRHHSGQDEVVVGTPIAGRNRAETEEMIGFFVNMLPLRADLLGDPTFAEVLRRVRETTLGAYAHQDVPFERMVEGFRIPRSLSHSAVYQAALVLHNTSGEMLSLPGVEVSRLDVGEQPTVFDVAVAATERPDGLAGSLVFSSDLFDPSTAARMADSLREVLEQATREPGRRLSELGLLRGEERVRIMEAWSANPRPYPEDRCAHQLFAARAERTPDAVALRMEDVRLTYAELDRRANRLARHLRRRGVSVESRVAVCMERSPDLVVALLAVLKAGAAYVPLDPAYPRERLEYMLADSGAAAVVTVAALASVLPPTGASVVAVDALDGEIRRESEADPAVPVDPENAAYLIYTSGSTGRPKGVVVRHRSLVNYAEAARADYGITAGERVLQFASISFDTSAEEIYPTLLGGATLVLRTEAMLGGAETFMARCAEWEITVLDLPTAYWHELVSEMERTSLRLPGCVRVVIIGGERALPEQVEAWARLAPGVRLVNTYGPTETTIVATAGEVAPAAASGPVSAPVPIGRPVANARAYVLDSTLVPVPAGVGGELFVGGDGVARGYLGRPGLTAERFLPDPYSPLAGARMYRTGDRVRWRRDGTLDFLGRMDDQVKVRGFRVELGEVESVLGRHPRVREAVVAAREEAPGRVQLVGYVVPDGAAPTASELRAFMKDALPEYMVPAAFVVLGALPLTPGGKVDRRALPEPDASAAEDDGHVAPRTPAERLLAEIWAEVLRLERVSVTDDFFELGGHSLLATQVIARVREATGAVLPLRALFQSPTLEALAERLPEPAAAATVETHAIRALGSDEGDLLLSRLDELSDEEVERLLAGLASDGRIDP